MTYAYDYLMKTSQELNSDYPYTAKDEECHHVTGKVNVVSYDVVKPNSWAQLKAAIDIAPVAVALQADSTVF